MKTLLSAGITKHQIIALLLMTITLIPSISFSDDKVLDDDVLVIDDPIFGLSMDFNKDRFDTIGADDFPDACRKYFTHIKRGQRRYKLFAQLLHDNIRIYVTEIIDDSISIFVARGDDCDAGSADSALLQFDSPILSNEEVVGIYKDALARYERALVGKTKFLNRLEENVELRKGGCMAVRHGSQCDGIFRRIQPFVVELVNDYRNSK